MGYTGASKLTEREDSSPLRLLIVILHPSFSMTLLWATICSQKCIVSPILRMEGSTQPTFASRGCS